MPSGDPGLRIEVATHLDHGLIDAVGGLRAEVADGTGISGLSEAAELAVSGGATTWHGLVWEGDRLVGYVQLRRPGAVGSVEAILTEAAGRSGASTEVLSRIRMLAPGPVTLWVRGETDPARHLAAGMGMRPGRELLAMRADLREADATHPHVPPGMSLRTFRVGSDEEAWLAANQAVFASLPDQGDWTMVDLRARLAQAWFRPEGFFLLVDAADDIAGFHWTKIHSGDECGCDSDCGEVYVVGVDEQCQGRGLGRYLTDVGLDYFRSLGIETAMLYVDASNQAAVRTYRSVGFSVFETTLQYVLD